MAVPMMVMQVYKYIFFVWWQLFCLSALPSALPRYIPHEAIQSEKLPPCKA